MQTGSQFYTAGQLSKALGKTARAVQMRLADSASFVPVSIRGQSTKAWAIGDLPAAIQHDLTRLASERGFSSVANLLADPPALWQPSKPWHEIPANLQTMASKLCNALARCLERQHELSGIDLMEMASAGYRQYFGHEITTAKLRYIMDRATRRDNGHGQWHRPELFLDDAAFNAKDTTPALSNQLHAPLDEIIATIADKAAPSTDDRRHLFHRAFQHFEKLTASHPSCGEQRALKLSLISFLYQHVPGIYKPQAAVNQNAAKKPMLAIRNAFNRDFQQWIASGRSVDALTDKRAMNCGRAGYTHAPCELKIKNAARFLRGAHGKAGNVTLAIKILSEKKEICAVCIEHFHPGRLSSSVRQRLTPNAIQVAAVKGAEAIRKIAPTHHCDWSDSQPGDRFVTDDMTTNELSWDQLPSGEIVSGQAQLLFFEDEYSSLPLPFHLYFGAPNSQTIAKSISTVLKTVGLPHVALLTERGVYANRRLAGQRGIQHHAQFRELQSSLEKYFQFDAIPEERLAQIRKSDLGFRDPAFRLNITQARSPQAKTIERSFYEFQKSASRLPGFAGFNQRNEKPRSMQDFDRRVATGKEHPGNEYLHLSDLRKNYELICEEIMNRPIDGTRHRGRSPLDLWKEAITRKPLRKLPPEIEAMLLTVRKPGIRVTSRGICVAINKYEDAFYFGDVTGPLTGQQVAIRFDPDIPDYIYVEHPKTAELLKVDRMMTNRRTATPEEISKVNAARRAHINGALGEIGNAAKNVFTAYVIRDNIYSPRDIAQGAQISADAEQHRQQQTLTKRELSALRQHAAILGDPGSIPSKPRNLDRQRESLKAEEDALRQIAEMENGGNEEIK